MEQRFPGGGLQWRVGMFGDLPVEVDQSTAGMATAGMATAGMAVAAGTATASVTGLLLIAVWNPDQCTLRTLGCI